MEPITLILTALATGATFVATTAAGEAVKDSYRTLKALIQHKFAGRAEDELVLAKHEEKPEVWEAPLKEALTRAAVGGQEEIIKAAQRLMTLVNPQQAMMGKYNVQITGNVQGFAPGDHNVVTMNFGDKPKEK